MIYSSNFATLRTPGGHDLPHDGVVEWEFDATTVTAKFPHTRGEDYYYVLWSETGDFTNDFHRSNPIMPDTNTPTGAILTKQILGFAPGSNWHFQVVSNFDFLAGEQ